MKIEKGSKYLVVNSRQQIQSFYKTFEAAQSEATHLNDVFNNRPHNEFGYALGHHDFEVIEFTESTDLSKFQFSLPNGYRAVKIGDQLFSKFSDAVEFYQSDPTDNQFEILVKYLDDIY